ncbi:MAG TPA: discoidin domain-containing protein, partial [Candidatus Paceibacterota bacterium]|nr:discoidin domain-containing protein [Candidatus Paceibacterota bacterium]
MTNDSTIAKLQRPRRRTLCHLPRIAGVCICLVFASIAGWAADLDQAPATAEYEQAIEADWLRQLARACAADDGSRVTPEADAAGACDGAVDEETAFHTERQEQPWWQVDLGSIASLSRIVIHNARDCPERARNLRLLLSDDGNAWQEVYRHNGQIFGT